MEIMQKIEKKYPYLVNCFGGIKPCKKCDECPNVPSCFNFKWEELKRRCYAPGKYRAGFGKKMPSKKTSMWIGDRDDV